MLLGLEISEFLGFKILKFCEFRLKMVRFMTYFGFGFGDFGISSNLG